MSRQTLSSAHTSVQRPDELLAELENLGRSCWPAVELQPGAFGAYLAEKASALADDVIHGLRSLHVADLYLACACVHRCAAALKAIEALHLREFQCWPRAKRFEPDFVDEVRQSVWIKLFVGDERRAPLIGSYSGRGALRSWLAVVAEREALTRLRAVGRSGARQELSFVMPAPDRLYLEAFCTAEFKSAISAAIEALPSRERSILKLSGLHGLGVEKLATMYGVNASTISRWLAAARERIRSATLRELSARLSLSRADVSSLCRAIGSDVEISFQRLLG